MILIKDNHLAALKQESPHPIAAALKRAKAKYPTMKIEIEADSLEQRLRTGDGGVAELESEDGRLLVVLGHVLYVRRHARGSRVGFSEGTEAAAPFHPKKTPVDAYCACILDRVIVSE